MIYYFSRKYKLSCRVFKCGFVFRIGFNSSNSNLLINRGGRRNYNKYIYIDYFRSPYFWINYWINKGIAKEIFLKNFNSACYICRFDFDSFRNRYLVLIYRFFEKSFSYILPITGFKFGDIIRNSYNYSLKHGDSTFLKYVPSGFVVSQISKDDFSASSYVRSSFSKAMVISSFDKNKEYRFETVCKLPSGFFKKFYSKSRCVIGGIANTSDKVVFLNSKKAGFYRNRGYRPIVRGVAKNPVDHPHGGGEGKKSNPSSPRSPWGWLIKK